MRPRLVSLLAMFRMHVLGWFSRRPVAVPGSSAPVVALTTHGVRARFVHLAIESIASGSVRPSELVLWLDDEELFLSPPPGIRRLMRRGLRLGLTANHGSHSKYFPTALGREAHAVALVTADDDWMVPPGWLEGLVRVHHEHPDDVVAHRVHRIAVRSGEIADYSRWVGAPVTGASPLNFGTGSHGQLLPPALLDRLRDEGTAFVACAPRADDDWLHRVGLRWGILTRSASALTEDDFVPIRGAGRFGGSALLELNVDAGGNDRQILATYEPELVALLVEATAAMTEPETAEAVADTAGSMTSVAP